MGRMLLSYVVSVVAGILPMLTQELRGLLETFARQFYAKAKKTENPWDDMLAGFIMAILGLKTN